YQINLSVLTWILGPGIALLVGFLKRQTLAKHWQVVLMLGVNLIVAFGRQVLANKGLIDHQLVQDFMGQVLTSTTMYQFVLKPLSEELNVDLTNLVPNFGVGPSPTRYGVDDVGDVLMDDGTAPPVAPPSDAQAPTDGTPF